MSISRANTCAYALSRRRPINDAVVKDALAGADRASMQTVDIHLAEMAGWRALLTEAQYVAKMELHAQLEEYLVSMLYRTTRPLGPAILDGPPPALSAEQSDPNGNVENLRAIGDHCLLSAGLFPEYAVQKNVPIAHFVYVGRAAYQEFGHASEEPTFLMLAEFFVDIMDVLQTLRDVENHDLKIDPLNAYQLWYDTGSVSAWNALQRFTHSLPGNYEAAAVH